MSYAVIRKDKPPEQWWDGYYHDLDLAKMMAKWWSKELRTPCLTIAAQWPAFPETGYHMNVE